MADSSKEIQRVTTHAYLHNVLLTCDAESTDSDEIHLETVIVPNRLRIRRVRREDLDRTRKRAAQPYEIHPPPDETIIIEWEQEESDYIDELYTVIDRTLLALRLLKRGSVFVNVEFNYIDDDRFVDKVSHLAVPHPLDRFNPLYKLDVSDSKELQRIFESLRNLNFREKSAFKIATERFSRYYYDIFYEDKLIDLCISFEALFIQEGTSTNYGMGNVIGLACSMLIGNDHNERAEIKSNIRKAFRFRNKIVHGSDFDWDEVYRLTPILEEYIRESLVLLVPNNLSSAMKVK